jgi:hypothetical protein
MRSEHPHPETKRILLSGVFGPYGVDDDFGRKENIMELFHNQVTKAQGTASFRFHHRSFGLYFLAANLDADVTVLDFPSRKRFMRELRKGYEVVGISFIAFNFLKAREMARLVREILPNATVILGGHGAAIEGVEGMIDCDHVVRGEGISWMRSFLGMDPEAPIRHPVLPSVERRSILGVPVPGGGASILVPGLGCVNGCKFCSTSHFFDRKYTSFISSGRELFETARRIADERGSDNFFVMDENFLKNRERALDFLAEMERHQRFFRFDIFSSAEAITAFGVDNLVRLGVGFVWIGVESSTQKGNFPKNEGIDARALIRQLRNRGISVLASGILCQEHHTPENIMEDVDFLVGLEADFVQFMLLTPVPGTALYQEYQERGMLRKDLPLEDWHGQKHLAFRHPAFPGDAPEQVMKKAFRKDYEVNSSSMYRVMDTSLRGYLRLAALPHRDACLETRMEQLREQTLQYAPIMAAVARHAVNPLERRRALDMARRVKSMVGGRTLANRVREIGARLLAARWKLRLRLFGDGLQPSTIVTRFSPGKPGVVSVPLARPDAAEVVSCLAASGG